MYLDPGFGGMLVQVVIAIVAMGGILLFTLRRKIRALFSGKKGAGANKDADLNRGAGAAGIAGVANQPGLQTDTDDAIDMLSDNTGDADDANYETIDDD